MRIAVAGTSYVGLSTDNREPVSKLSEALPARFTHSDRIENYALEKSGALLRSLINKPENISHYIDENLGEVMATDSTDGIRVTFKKGDIVPSGNAPELRCYVESYDLVKAKIIVSTCLNRICDAGT